MEILNTLDSVFEKVFPIIFLMILGIGVILCLFGVSTVKHMKWRRTTGWASGVSLILVIIYPPFLEFFTFSDFLRDALSVLPEVLSRFLSFILGVLFPFGLQVLILGTTTILLSRTFTYRVKSTPGAVKWILAILLGVGSCVCFISLYWFTLRSFLTGGESQLIPAIITVSAGVAVGSASLVVNLIECTGLSGKN
jgi:nitrate reductase gamma subunit